MFKKAPECNVQHRAALLLQSLGDSFAFIYLFIYLGLQNAADDFQNETQRTSGRSINVNAVYV